MVNRLYRTRSWESTVDVSFGMRPVVSSAATSGITLAGEYRRSTSAMFERYFRPGIWSYVVAVGRLEENAGYCR